ncbi:DUF983 domain-containing protein [Roseibium denhamense]|uniref:Uncharacterized conserved protein, DUF983 family n=1 Tax=Roseibium denhamense TaxID=76305 RepID=A0ABY1P2U2_9HYPH|nr:DUF983 domain-containing protein [Roseibium denhamense]MTI07724.1 DUF983 domain-containing protein [Roseibium denhamense]SMP24872.1 Uncharacterized conserved protein, DUF983 family [Roseibium denhamense]
MHDDKAHYAPVNPVPAGLSGRCPRCGEGKLFDGFLALKPSCTNCGLNYDFADSGDGPAVFVIMIVGFIIVGLVLFVELSFQPPIWVHLILWLPLTVVLAGGTLRPLKGLMIALQYRHQAAEGRLDKPDET